MYPNIKCVRQRGAGGMIGAARGNVRASGCLKGRLLPWPRPWWWWWWWWGRGGGWWWWWWIASGCLRCDRPGHDVITWMESKHYEKDIFWSSHLFACTNLFLVKVRGSVLFRQYYPEGGWGWVVVFVGAAMLAFTKVSIFKFLQALFQGIHLSFGVLIKPAVWRFRWKLVGSPLKRQFSPGNYFQAYNFLLRHPEHLLNCRFKGNGF